MTTQHQDPQLDLFTRISLLLCAVNPEAVRVKRVRDGTIIIIPNQENYKHFAGVGGSRIRALRYLGSRMTPAVNIQLANTADEMARTDALRFQGLDRLTILKDLVREVTGYQPDVSDQQDQHTNRFHVWIPAQFCEPSVTSAIDDVLYRKGMGFKFIAT